MKPGSEIILALGGGSARGIAHIGVIRALEEAGYKIAGVAGTSIGAVVGGAYCAGAMDAYEEFMASIDRFGVLRMLDPVLPRSGLFAGMRLAELMRSFVGDVNIEDLSVPYLAVAVDVSGGDEVRIRRGSLVGAMRASYGIPGLFTPFALDVSEGADGLGRKRRRWLVDGGVASPVPVMASRDLGNFPIVAVNVNRSFPVPSIVVKNENHAPSPSRRERLVTFLDGERVPRAARDFLRSFLESSPSDSEDPVDRPAEEVLEELDAGDEDESTDSRASFLSRWLGMFSSGDKSLRRPGMIDSLYNSVVLLQHHLARSQFLVTPPALLIEPNMEGVGLFDYQLGKALVEEGHRATRVALSAIPKD